MKVIAKECTEAQGGIVQVTMKGVQDVTCSKDVASQEKARKGWECYKSKADDQKIDWMDAHMDMYEVSVRLCCNYLIESNTNIYSFMS